MSLNIAAVIQSQMLQTLLQALQTADQHLKAGDTVEAKFVGWADPANAEADNAARAQSAAARAPGTTPGTASALSEAIVQLGGKPTTLLIEATPERRAQLHTGATLTLQVEAPASDGAPHQMRLLTIQPARDAAAGGSVAVPRAQSDAKDLATLKIGLPAPDPVRAQAGPLIGAALARQNGLAPLYADLDALVRAASDPHFSEHRFRFSPMSASIRDAVTVPETVRLAALRTLAMRTEAAGLEDQPETLKAAIRSSGLFHEAMLANGVAPEAGQDLKSALLLLKQSLREALGQTAAGQPHASRLPADEDVLLPLPSGEKALPGDSRSARPNPASDSPNQAAAPRPLAPSRDGLPVPQAVALPSIDARTDSVETMMVKALERTESALDRLSIGQFASLPSHLDPAQGAPLNRWFTELPLALDGRTAILPLDIEEDGSAGGAGGPQAKLWRVRFAMDVEPMGPVHAMVTMQGRTIGVTVWAERDTTSKLVREHAADLKAALLDSDFDNPQIEVLAGQPMKRAAHAGHYLDRRS